MLLRHGLWVAQEKHQANLPYPSTHRRQLEEKSAKKVLQICIIEMLKFTSCLENSCILLIMVINRSDEKKNAAYKIATMEAI